MQKYQKCINVLIVPFATESIFSHRFRTVSLTVHRQYVGFESIKENTSFTSLKTKDIPGRFLKSSVEFLTVPSVLAPLIMKCQ